MASPYSLTNALVNDAPSSTEPPHRVLTARNVWSKAHWAFNIFLILLHWADLATDLMVAVELHGLEGGRGRTWCWLIAADLCLMGAVLAVYAIEGVRRDFTSGCTVFPLSGEYTDNLTSGILRVLWYPIGFLTAPLLPLLRVIAVANIEARSANFGFRSSYRRDNLPWESAGCASEVVPRLLKKKAKLTNSGKTLDASAAAKEELRDFVRSLRFLTILDEAISRAKDEHVMLVLQTLVESLPQAVMQLMVIALHIAGGADGPSRVQLASISISLLCLLSKSYLICRAADVSMVLVKVIAVAFDICAFAYTIAVLFDPHQQHSVQLFGLNVYVSPLNAALVCCTVIGIGGLLLLGCFVGISILLDGNGKAAVTVLILLGIIPACFGFIVAKAMLIVGLVFQLEPSAHDTVCAAQLFQFMHRGKDRNIKLGLVYANMAKQSAGIKGNAYQRVTLSKVEQPEKFEPHEIWKHYTWPVAVHRLPCCYAEMQGRYQSAFSNVPYDIPLRVTACCYGLVQLFGAVYPVLAFALNYHQQTTFQLWMFILYAFFASCLLLTTSVAVVPYVTFLLHTSPIWRNWFDTYAFASPHAAVWQTIQDYYIPPHLEAVKAAIPSHLLPFDVASRVAEHLAAKHVDTSRMARSEVEHLKRQVDEQRAPSQATTYGTG